MYATQRLSAQEFQAATIHVMTSLERYALVALGGAAGALLRYAAAMQFGARASTTFAVNITGSFLIGVLAASVVDPRWRLLAGAGFLGGYTTFSTWQLEALLSVHAEDWRGAALNLFGSVAAGFAAVVLGYAAGFRLR
jgi:CrcB protein